MFKKPLKLSLILSLLLVSIEARADILYLKNGNHMEGIVSKETEEQLVLETEYGSVKIHKKDIEKIERLKEEDAESLKSTWLSAKENQKQTKEKMSPAAAAHFSNSIHVDTILNGKVSAELIVDTGASMVLLSNRLGRKLGLQPSKLQHRGLVEVADGRKVEVAYVKLARVDVENQFAENVDALVLLNEKDDLSDEGLLGMSFLNRFNFQIDPKFRTLKLISNPTPLEESK